MYGEPLRKKSRESDRPSRFKYCKINGYDILRSSATGRANIIPIRSHVIGNEFEVDGRICMCLA
jgi:hypothetical protein